MGTLLSKLRPTKLHKADKIETGPIDSPIAEIPLDPMKTLTETGKLHSNPIESQRPHETRILTETEQRRLARLGSISGTPGLITDALSLGNILDPSHMDRALAIQDEHERGRTTVNEVLKWQAEMCATELAKSDQNDFIAHSQNIE
jgi:hypothetical protein